MSGGSFNYLFMRDASTDLTPASEYEAMADYAAEQGWNRTVDKLRTLATMARGVEAKHRELRDLMHDVEWTCSGDYCAESFRDE